MPTPPPSPAHPPAATPATAAEAEPGPATAAATPAPAPAPAPGTATEPASAAATPAPGTEAEPGPGPAADGTAAAPPPAAGGAAPAPGRTAPGPRRAWRAPRVPRVPRLRPRRHPAAGAEQAGSDDTGPVGHTGSDGSVPTPAGRGWLAAVTAAGRRAAGRDRTLALAVGAAAFAVYLWTLLPGVGYSGDTAKWQFLGAVGGTPHPTGYPFYLLVNRGFVHAVPLGSLAWRVNLLSAVLGAATVSALFVLLRTLDVRRSVAAATAATFAVTYTFWSQAVVAEVYTIHLLLLTVVTLCLARWLAGGSDRWLLAGLGFLALSFGNHIGTALALPGVVWLAGRDRRRALRPANLAWVALFAVLGAAQYSYLVWMTRVGAYVEQPVRELDDLVEVVTGGRFREQMLAFGPGELMRDRLPMFGRLLHGELSVLLVPAAYGLVQGLRGPQRAVVVHLAALGTLAAVYALNFDVLDVFVFFLPCYLALAVFLGLGAEALATRLARQATPGRRSGPWRLSHGWGWAAAAALALVPLVTGLVNYPRASQRGAVGDAQRIERAIDAAGTGAVLVTDNYADSEFFWYYLLGEGLGDERDLELVDQIPPGHVVAFFEGRGGPLARVATARTPVYTATARQAVDLAAAGLTVTEVADDVWRITAG